MSQPEQDPKPGPTDPATRERMVLDLAQVIFARSVVERLSTGEHDWRHEAEQAFAAARVFVDHWEAHQRSSG